MALKENKVGTTLISGYNYTVNNLGQRSNVAQTGTAFAANRNIAWGYDSLGQVVSADSDNNPDDRAYEFDAIGNRLKSADSLTLPASNNYTPNALNQYTAVNALNPAYDSDGNMTSGPLSAYPSANSTLQWDGENRLISTTINGVTTTYQYDSQSRRISKTTSGATTVLVYDGWNPIAEYVSSAITKANTWGMDLSGTMQGAGGVGGLLAVKIGSATYYPTFDGNGNVSEYLDSTGAITAHFEYDPFGRTVADTDSGGLFSHRFSTKPIDSETGLYYYGYRYLDVGTGRWPSRDPIEEEGGVNLYGFVGNDAANQIDVLGTTSLYDNLLDEREFELSCGELEVEGDLFIDYVDQTPTTRSIRNFAKKFIGKKVKSVKKVIDLLESGAVATGAGMTSIPDHIVSYKVVLELEFECDCDGLFGGSEWDSAPADIYPSTLENLGFRYNSYVDGFGPYNVFDPDKHSGMLMSQVNSYYWDKVAKAKQKCEKECSN